MYGQTDRRTDGWTDRFPLCSTGLRPLRSRCPKAYKNPPARPPLPKKETERQTNEWTNRQTNQPTNQKDSKWTYRVGCIRLENKKATKDEKMEKEKKMKLEAEEEERKEEKQKSPSHRTTDE